MKYKKLSKEIKDEIFHMHYEGYSTYEIAKKLNLAEIEVIRVLWPDK